MRLIIWLVVIAAVVAVFWFLVPGGKGWMQDMMGIAGEATEDVAETTEEAVEEAVEEVEDAEDESTAEEAAEDETPGR